MRDPNDAIDLDDVLPKIGEFGIYQKFLLWFVCLPACLPCGFCAFNQLFMTDTPDHWCRIPEIQNLTIEERKSLFIPRKVKILVMYLITQKILKLIPFCVLGK